MKVHRIKRRILRAMARANAAAKVTTAVVDKVVETTTNTTTTIIPQEINPITRKIDVEICIHCWNYQRRLCWMLSSILQQQGELPNITVNLSYAPDNGNPKTEDVIKLFRDKGLNIKETILKTEEMPNRAIARNIQAKETTADWIIFADADMVYDVDFFSDLQKQLQNNLRNEAKVMGADRISLKPQPVLKYFQEDQREYPCIISEVAKLAATFKIMWIIGKGTAPGSFQLAKVTAIKHWGGKYTWKQKDHWRLTRSDRQFRRMLRGNVPINAKKQWHINHDRGDSSIQR